MATNIANIAISFNFYLVSGNKGLYGEIFPELFPREIGKETELNSKLRDTCFKISE